MADIEKLTDVEEVDFNFFVENDVSVPTGPIVVTDNKTNKKAISTKKKSSTQISDDGTEVVDMHTLDSYTENMNELKRTVQQFDSLANDLKQDLDAVRASRTLKGKYQYTSLIAGNLASLLTAKVQAIREMNNTIKSSIELDYKIEKDRKDAMNGDDDKRLMDMYNAFISSPVSTAQRSMLGPNEQQLTLMDNGVQMVGRPVAGSLVNGVPSSGDPGFDNYIRN